LPKVTEIMIEFVNINTIPVLKLDLEIGIDFNAKVSDGLLQGNGEGLDKWRKWLRGPPR